MMAFNRAKIQGLRYPMSQVRVESEGIGCLHLEFRCRSWILEYPAYLRRQGAMLLPDATFPMSP